MRSGPDTSQWSITAIGFPGYQSVEGMRGSTETSYIQAKVNNHRYRKSNVLNTALLDFTHTYSHFAIK